ncbi:hypothetical protein ACQU0X_12055 [Pseudovibrio ascidiaceicola]|uniref:hypothetical protein n=1 Tax=Pseudovibrio ascidiaceicola TaxID=285279 RepID=UPI003D36E8D0
MSTMKHPNIIAGNFETLSGQSMPKLQFHLPEDDSISQFQYAVWGQNTDKEWVYFDPNTKAYKQFEASSTHFTKECLFTPAFQDGVATLQLPTGVYLSSGVVVMFSGQTKGVPIGTTTPSVPTILTNPGEVFALFELTYAIPPASTAAGSPPPLPTLDIDISSIDQIGLPYTVKSSGAHVPFPMSYVGTPLSMSELATRFKARFAAQSPFAQCLKNDPSQLIAPQDILTQTLSPNKLPTCTPTGPTSSKHPNFLKHSYYYKITESLPNGETTASDPVYSGILLDAGGKPQSSEVKINWGTATNPIRYVPQNANATGLNIYRAAVRPADTPKAKQAHIPPAPTDLDAYDHLTSMSIEVWNKQQDHAFVDDGSLNVDSSKHPPATSYGANALSTWFDSMLEDFFTYYMTHEFAYYQTHQSGTGRTGTLWRGKVKLVTPYKDDPITEDKYWGSEGKQLTPTAKWQWGNGSVSYLVLQLIGNAYNDDDLSQIDLNGVKTIKTSEYEGDVLNIYFPWFKENTGLARLQFKDSTDYDVPPAPHWMENTGFFPSQMVFGCAGVFATANDLDAMQQALITKNGVPVKLHGKLQYNGLAAKALANLENVLVSAMNRGVATGYKFGITPQQYTCSYAFSKPATVAASKSGVSKGTYTYFLAGILKDGSETSLSVPLTVHLNETSHITLHWNPQPEPLYCAIRIYRRKSGEDIFQVNKEKIPNTNGVASYTDTDQVGPATPYVFYSDLAKPDQPSSNEYSGFLHQDWSSDPATGISINGLVYGYPFDDMGGFSTNINFGVYFPQVVDIYLNGAAPAKGTTAS